jgi:hypothetical protein
MDLRDPSQGRSLRSGSRVGQNAGTERIVWPGEVSADIGVAGDVVATADVGVELILNVLLNWAIADLDYPEERDSIRRRPDSWSLKTSMPLPRSLRQYPEP